MHNFLQLSFLLVLALSFNAKSQEIELAKLSYIDINGATVSNLAATVTERSIVLVTDANRPLTNTIIGKLRAGKTDWKGKLIVVLSGNLAEAKNVVSTSQLIGVRWYVTPPSRAPAAFGVGGTPFVVGVHPMGTSAWKILGEPQIADNNFSKLRGWIESSPTPTPTK